jgi:hypothetical protein
VRETGTIDTTLDYIEHTWNALVVLVIAKYPHHSELDTVSHATRTIRLSDADPIWSVESTSSWLVSFIVHFIDVHSLNPIGFGFGFGLSHSASLDLRCSANDAATTSCKWRRISGSIAFANSREQCGRNRTTHLFDPQLAIVAVAVVAIGSSHSSCHARTSCLYKLFITLEHAQSIGRWRSSCSTQRRVVIVVPNVVAVEFSTCKQ